MKMLKNKSRKTRKNYTDDEDVVRYFLSEIQGHDDDDVEEYIESDDIRIFEGTPKEYAEDVADDMGPMMTFTNSDYYFDFDSFGRDLKIDAALEGGLEEELEEKEQELADADEDDWNYEDLEEEIDTLKESIKYYEDMSDEDYGIEFVSSMYGDVSDLPKQTQESYFDYDAVARDMELNGEIIEFEYGGNTYVGYDLLGADY